MEKKKFIIDNKVVFYTGLIYFIIMALFVGLKICSYFNLFNFDGASYVYKIIIQIGLMFVLPVCLYMLFLKKEMKQTFSAFSFKKISGKAIFISVLLGICGFILIGYISSLWSGFLSIFGYRFGESTSSDLSVLNFVLSILFVGILPGFCEEIAHRGLVLGGIKKNGTIRAVVLCGLLFGLMHFNPVQFGYAFVAGMLFSVVTLLSRSIFPAMIMHFTNNTLSTIVSFSSADWFPSGAIDWFYSIFNSGNVVLVVILNFLLIALVVYFLFYLLMKLFVEAKKMEFKRFQKNFKKEIESTPLVSNIDANNSEQVMEIYQEVNFLNLEKKIAEGHFTAQDLIEGVDTKKSVELMLSDNFSLPEKKKYSNYIFYYMAIFLGSAGTILAFILNVI